MTAAPKATIVTSPISVYRLHLADLAQAAGTKVNHISTVETHFTKGQATLVTIWGQGQLLEAATTKGQMVAAKGSKGRLQKVWAWVTGDSTISENTLFTNRAASRPDMAALKARVAKGAIKAPAPKAEAKGQVQAKVTPKAKAPAKAGPSNEARQAARDAEAIKEM